MFFGVLPARLPTLLRDAIECAAIVAVGGVRNIYGERCNPDGW